MNSKEAHVVPGNHTGVGERKPTFKRVYSRKETKGKINFYQTVQCPILFNLTQSMLKSAHLNWRTQLRKLI